MEPTSNAASAIEALLTQARVHLAEHQYDVFQVADPEKGQLGVLLSSFEGEGPKNEQSFSLMWEPFGPIVRRTLATVRSWDGTESAAILERLWDHLESGVACYRADDPKLRQVGFAFYDGKGGVDIIRIQLTQIKDRTHTTRDGRHLGEICQKTPHLREIFDPEDLLGNFAKNIRVS
jgi:hypothetical protein